MTGIYHGYSESQEQIDARTLRRALNGDAVNLYLRQTSEIDADKIHLAILFAEGIDERIRQAAEIQADTDWIGPIPSRLAKRLESNPSVDISHLYGGRIKVTASLDWCKRHLNEEQYSSLLP